MGWNFWSFFGRQIQCEIEKKCRRWTCSLWLWLKLAFPVSDDDGDSEILSSIRCTSQCWLTLSATSLYPGKKNNPSEYELWTLWTWNSAVRAVTGAAICGRRSRAVSELVTSSEHVLIDSLIDWQVSAPDDHLRH